MIIQPNGKLYLLRGVKCDPNYQNTLTWANATEQFNYFSSLAFYKFEKASDNELSYIYYGDGKIRIGLKNTAVFNCNYIMFQNPDFENKWFYAFVTSVEYVNNVTTQINFEIDVMQTWLPTVSINKCFVEREHVADDTIGLHTVDEGLPTGDIIYTNCTPVTGVSGKSFDDLAYIVECSFDPSAQGRGTPTFKKIGGLFHGAVIVAFTNERYKDFSDFLFWVNVNGLGDGVCSIYSFPECLLEYDTTSPYLILQYVNSEGTLSSINCYGKIVIGVKTDAIATASVLPHLYKYTPNNNKLLSAPFNYLSLSNNVGQSVQLRFERLKKNTEIKINYYAPLEAGATAVGEVLDYDCDNNGSQGIVSLAVAAMGQCAYSYDRYADYIALNRSSLDFQKSSAALSDTLRIMGTGNSAMKYFGGAAVTGGASLSKGGINNALDIARGIMPDLTGTSAIDGYNAGLSDMGRQPNAMIGRQSSSAAILKGRNHLTLYTVSILPEYAKIIDNYLSMFGYKVLREKVPETVSRQNWNYVKTVGATISGNVPADDSRKICALLDRGITLWHNPSTMLNYSLDNPIV